MEVLATMVASLGGFDDQWIFPGPLVVANPGYLPANAQSGAAAGDAEFPVAKR